MSEYSDKLKHPLWQKKRLEILNRDGFKCRACGGEDEMLHVHHLRYLKARDPWDYNNSSLVTLCHVCHDMEHAEFQAAKHTLIDSFRDRGALHGDFYSFAVALDLSGSNDVQMSRDEWTHLAWVVQRAMEYRNAGGCLKELRGEFLSFCQLPEEK